MTKRKIIRIVGDGSYGYINLSCNHSYTLYNKNLKVGQLIECQYCKLGFVKGKVKTS